MPSFAFKGFATGAPVALSVAQGAAAVSESVTGWGQNMGHVEILTVAAPAITAPAGIWFEAIGLSGFDVPGGPGPDEVYDPSAHAITYVWTVRGSPFAAYATPENMPPAWNDPNRAYGKKVALFFPEPGTYTVDLRAVDRSGTAATAETTVTVADPDAYYAGTRTICFSDDPGETWAGEKPGCVRATTYAAVQAALPTAGTPPRLLFKRGRDTKVYLDLDTKRLGYVGAWGTGARPIVRPEDANSVIFRVWNDSAMTHMTFTDCDFRGGWDASVELGGLQKPWTFSASPTTCHYQVWGCSFDGFDEIDCDTNAPNCVVLFGNFSVKNWRNYGFLISSNDQTLGFTGYEIAQHPDALHGGPKGEVPHNNHGPLRLSFAQDVYLGPGYIFSRTGWSGATGDDLADQPCIRGNAGGVAGVYRNYDRMACEGGTGACVVMSGSNDGTQENPGSHIFDKVLMIGTGKSKGGFIDAQMGGCTIRNMYGYLPNVPQRIPGGWNGAVNMRADNPGPGNMDAPMEVYNSTVYVARDAANDPALTYGTFVSNAGFTDVTVENNVVHAPDADTPVTGDGPFGLAETIAGLTLRFKGVRYNFRSVTGSLASAVGHGASFTVPYASITRRTWGNADTTPTDQAYWQAIAGTDTRHVIVVGGSVHRAEDGAFTVTPGASGLAVTNTSGATWAGGAAWSFRPDRKSLIPAMDTSYGAFGQTLPLPRPLPGSPAHGGGALGLAARQDALDAERGDPPSAGAFEPA